MANLKLLNRAESCDALIADIGDGAKIALPADYSGCAMSAIAALARRGVRDLHLVGVPTLGLQADWLIGAGAVATIEAAAMTMGEFGIPPRFQSAFKARELHMIDGTCPAIHAGLQAAEKGVPFLPLRGILGSDLAKHRDDWIEINNPFADAGTDAHSGTGGTSRDPILLIGAIQPDATVFHAPAADRNGNVWVGIRRELMLMAHASRMTLVTVEEIRDDDFLADDTMAAGTIPALYVDRIAEVPRGGDPVGLAGLYPADEAAVKGYMAAARTEDGFADWAADHLGLKVPA